MRYSRISIDFVQEFTYFYKLLQKQDAIHFTKSSFRKCIIALL